jgi:hypothetical protein
LLTETYDSHGMLQNRKSLARQAHWIPKAVGVPGYRDFTTIRRNYHAKDEEVLRYVPYFGETDDVDLSDIYKVEVHSVPEQEAQESKFS